MAKSKVMTPTIIPAAASAAPRSRVRGISRRARIPSQIPARDPRPPSQMMDRTSDQIAFLLVRCVRDGAYDGTVRVTGSGLDMALLVSLSECGLYRPSSEIAGYPLMAWQ